MTNITASFDGKSLRQMLAITERDIGRAGDREVLAGAIEAAGTRERTLLRHATLPSLGREITDQVSSFLQGPAIGVFAAAWVKYRDLKQCALHTKQHAGTSETVHLADHEFSYDVAPEIEIQVDGKRALGIPLALSLACRVTGLVLRLQDGGVCEVRAGTAVLSGALSLGGTTLWHCDLHTVELPGTLVPRPPVSLV